MSRRKIHNAIFFLALLVPVAATLQFDESRAAEVHATPAAPNAAQNTTQKNAVFPCFEARDGEPAEAQEMQALANLPTDSRNWLTEDAAYIISPEERCLFLRLESDKERDLFIDDFWRHRDSYPLTLENPFKQEHYRRIVFANEEFGTDVPGWKTDRGRAYVRWGAPDKIESQLNHEPSWNPPEDGPRDAKYSWEEWHYPHVEGVGENVDLVFADLVGTGDYRLIMSPQYKAALLFSPPSFVERDPFDGKMLKPGPNIFVGPIHAAGPVKYKDLESTVTSGLIRDKVHFHHRVDYSRATHASTVATIAVDWPTEQISADGYHLFGRITKSSGWVLYTFERSGNVPGREEPGQQDPAPVTAVALEPGTYQLALVVKDLTTGDVGFTRTTLEVPSFEDLAASDHRH